MPLKITAAAMVAEARKRIEEIPAAQAIGMLDDPDVLIVDLRDVRERERGGFIPDSFHCPRGMLEFWIDPDSPYFKPVFGEDRKFVFHCASGWRSALAVDVLKNMGFEAAHISDGFTGWKDAGGPVEFKQPKD
jgi:rhodanese-related sulfurtransferase